MFFSELSVSHWPLLFKKKTGTLFSRFVTNFFVKLLRVYLRFSPYIRYTFDATLFIRTLLQDCKREGR